MRRETPFNVLTKGGLSMKYVTLVFIIFLFVFLNQLSAEWKERNNGLPSAWAATCCISACNETTAAIGIYTLPDGHIYLTTNAGLNWREIQMPAEAPDLNIIDIAMIDTNKIWICSADADPATARIFATSDGGKNWEKQFLWCCDQIF
jgi:hypothetical protein